MKRKLLGASLAAVFTISMIGFAAASGHPGWLGFDNGTQESSAKKNTSVLSFVSADVVPRSPTTLSGFAWIYDGATLDGTNYDAFAITSHDAPLFLDDDSYNEIRDSTQNPNNWHPHNVILNVTQGAGNAHLCVVSLADAPNAGIAFDEDTQLVKVNVKNSALKDTITDAPFVAAFSIVVADNCWATTIGTELVGDANIAPHAGVPLGIQIHQLE